jgi:hypothetical protein
MRARVEQEGLFPAATIPAHHSPCLKDRVELLRDVSSSASACAGKEATMSDFPECLLIVTVEIDPAVEDEWNRWYDTVHLPDALKCPGVRRGRRYVSVGEVSESIGGTTGKSSRRIYTTIYELDDPGAVATAEFQAMRGWYHFAPHVRSRTQVIVPAG